MPSRASPAGMPQDGFNAMSGGRISFLPPWQFCMMTESVCRCGEGAKRPMSLCLEPVAGKGLKIPIDKAIIFIGRHPRLRYRHHTSRMISRKHFALVQIDIPS